MMRIRISKKLFGPNGPMHLEADLEIGRYEMMGLFGKSGSGKTTLLRIVAGLEEPDEGLIEADGIAWFDRSRRINLSPQKRQCGFVFQDHALFPNMTVEGNLLYAAGPAETPEKLRRLLELTELTELRGRYPTTLSGGQKQRVALARAVARSPRVLLLDEAMASLDAELKASLLPTIKRWHTELGLTTLVVSHDAHDMLQLADRVARIEDGNVQTPERPSAALFGSSKAPVGHLEAKFLRAEPEPNGDSRLIYVVPRQTIEIPWPREETLPARDGSLSLRVEPNRTLL